MIDSWDYKDYIDIQFDSQLIKTNFSLLMSRLPMIEDVCGELRWKDLPNIKIFGSVAHSSPNVTLKFISGLDEYSSNESFGFRDITMTFFTSSNATTGFCGTSSLVVFNQSQRPMP